MPNFNVSDVFECGRNNPDLLYESVYMATSGDEFFTEMLDHLNECNDRHGKRLSIKKLKEFILHIMEEEEE